MLRLTIPARELYDEVNEEFVMTRTHNLQLEHSLVSISKWEAYWNKPFLTKDIKTTEETLHYIQCMTITQNVPPEVYHGLSNGNMKSINQYIEAPMTATIINKDKKGNSREVITSEIIYYWMISLNIPLECQKWHVNRLLTLVNVCNIKNQPPEKMGRKDLHNRNRSLNASRRDALNTKG